jgi:hypothetical protein
MRNETPTDIYLAQADRSFWILAGQIQKKSSEKNRTGCQGVMQFLMDQDKMWHMSWELIGKKSSKGDWLSHRAPARASDLALHHPDLVEARKIGRYSAYRARLENIEKIYEFLK